MKLSFTTFMRAYTFFSILFFIFGAIAISIGGPSFLARQEWNDPSVESAFVAFRMVVVAFLGSGLVISSLFLLIVRKRGFVAYKRIIDRLSSERSMSFNLNISFPEHDEFGNLGKWLNKFIAKLREFDRIKVERLRAAQQTVAFLSEAIGKALIILSNEGKITYANSQFGKSLNIGEKTISGLPINKVIENEKLLATLEELKEKPKNQVLTDLKIKKGEVVYKTKIRIFPIISSEVSLMETMIIFDSLQKKVLPI